MNNNTSKKNCLSYHLKNPVLKIFKDYKMNKMKNEMINKEEINALTHKIIGCAMKVHNTLGNGFQEVIYQRALAIEMQNQALAFQREMEMPIYYEGIEIGTRRVDFFVEDKVMVELKALEKLEAVPESMTKLGK